MFEGEAVSVHPLVFGMPGMGCARSVCSTAKVGTTLTQRLSGSPFPSKSSEKSSSPFLAMDSAGMAGSFGYEATHYDVSMKMAEASLLPKVRAAEADTLIVADGTSCRHQIHDGAQREAIHVARVLAQALA